jgi:hypothetical protein
MKTLRQTIKEELLVEKRIAQVSASLDVLFSFTRPIVNAEIKEIISMVKTEIAEKIVKQEIKTETDFVVKSLKWELAIAITPVHVGGTHWELIIKTVFRESKYDPFRVGKDQLVIYSDI